MTHIITATGAEYHISGHGLRPVKAEDIAHQLAQINRFTGACIRPYSVAEHSLLVWELAARAGASTVVQLAALLHDAHEIYTNDLASPAKQAVDSVNNAHAWCTFEYIHKQHVRRAFGLLTTFAVHAEQIREWDLIALATERRDLLPYSKLDHLPWHVLRDDTDNPVQPADIDLNTNFRETRSWKHWRTEFALRLEQLQHTLAREQALATEAA